MGFGVWAMLLNNKASQQMHQSATTVRVRACAYLRQRAGVLLDITVLDGATIKPVSNSALSKTPSRARQTRNHGIPSNDDFGSYPPQSGN